ncbi:hypothetical protein LX99_04240 [Mucilaginibacter oryzae]|uniref:Uncharacterized protein n=1 Tax=Mucilaginibacter oryzae TaxID=468058 RepID=A0A316H2M8_9SPHI|nr:hypothetical protein [Mucilaginibacter oryzae]PWK72910.1 hypothetical protein LX99_04240 [Mucilaginibacter oryzae]
METEGLITSTGIYVQLAEMTRCHDSVVSQSQSRSEKIQVLCSEARNTWASTAFSDIKAEALCRYFSYQAKSITAIFDLVDQQRAKTDDGKKLLLALHKELLLLLDHLVNYFEAYVDINIDAPYAFKERLVREVSSKIHSIYAWSDKVAGAQKSMAAAVLSYLQYFESSGKQTVFNFGELLFFVKFVNRLHHALQACTDADIGSFFADQLLKLGFNHYAVFEYFQSVIRQRLKGKSPEKKKSSIDTELRLLAYDGDQGGLRYDYRWPRLGDMLTDWLLEEQKKLEKESQPLLTACKNNRIHVTLSVSQLAGLAKYFVKEKVFGDQAVNHVFAFFTNSFSSKRQEVFSQGNFIKEYYSISQVTAAELRDLLLRMVARINRDFFPAVAAAGLLILFR